MNRLGWALLIAFVAVGAGFWLLTGGGVHRVGGGGREAASSPVAEDAGARPEEAQGALLIPVAGVTADALLPTFEQARDGGARPHNAIDIMAPRGTPVIAAMPGVVERLFTSERGGLTAYVRSEDGGWIAYYAHLDGYAAGLVEGARLAAGDAIGTVGSTGNAEDDAPHLHFALHRMAPGEGWSGGVPVDPHPLLAGRRAPPALAAPPGAR